MWSKNIYTQLSLKWHAQSKCVSQCKEKANKIKSVWVILINSTLTVAAVISNDVNSDKKIPFHKKKEYVLIKY